jgi:hypothetical protein
VKGLGMFSLLRAACPFIVASCMQSERYIITKLGRVIRISKRAALSSQVCGLGT